MVILFIIMRFILICLLSTFPLLAEDQESFFPEEDSLSRETPAEEEEQDWRTGVLANIVFPSQYIKPSADLGFPEAADSADDGLRDGFALFQKGDFGPAVLKFRQVFKKSSRLANIAHYYEMLCFLKAADMKKAMEAYQSLCASTLDPDLSVRAGIEIVRAGVSCPEPFCLDMIEKLLQKTHDPELLFLAAQRYSSSGQYFKSVNCCLDLFKKYPHSPLADSVLALFRGISGKVSLGPEKSFVFCRFLFVHRQYKPCLDLSEPLAQQTGPLRKKFLSLSGHSAYALKQYDQSLSLFRRLEKEEGPSPASTLYIARCYDKLNKEALSHSKYLEYLILYPKSMMCENILWDIASTHEENREYNEAVSFYTKLYRQYREGSLASKAYFKHAYCVYKKGQKDSAVAIFCRHGEYFSGDAETSASFYWAGHTYEIGGARDSAVKWFKKSIENNALCYYAGRSREKLRSLKADSVLRCLDSVSFATPKDYFLSLKTFRREYPVKIDSRVLSAFYRGLTLLRCGLYDFARRELKPIEQFMNNDFLFQYRLIKAYEAHGFFREAYRLSRNLIVKISSQDYLKLPEEVVKTFYPRYFGEVVDAECIHYGIDPLLIHALIRQESVYNPSVVSLAGAVGLMQLMPATAKDEARQLKIAFAEDSLYNPVYNIRIGIHHVNGLLQRFSQKPELMLCAYNAGTDVTRRWIQSNNGLEYDAFIEEIGYIETRSYVQKCMDNYCQYKKYWSSR